jgi:hypothetical protein
MVINNWALLLSIIAAISVLAGVILITSNNKKRNRNILNYIKTSENFIYTNTPIQNKN